MDGGGGGEDGVSSNSLETGSSTASPTSNISLSRFIVSLSRVDVKASLHMTCVLKLKSSSVITTAMVGINSSSCESGLKFWLVRLEKSAALLFKLVVGCVVLFLDLSLVSFYAWTSEEKKNAAKT